MARVFPFRPYRYTERAGPLSNVVTQPYDKITPEMQERYLSQSPCNLVRVILGPRFESDSLDANVYTRAADHLNTWIEKRILARDAESSFFVYTQEFRVPETGERLTRQGFIGLGALEEYAAGIVYRHEQTLTGPKKDRLELLRHTHAHFGQLFMLYADPAGEIDRILKECTAGEPLGAARDEYRVDHRYWRVARPEAIETIRKLMADKKLLIADGHHRYETALAFRQQNPDLIGADRVMMTFVNMHSPGLKILATHRLVSNLPDFDEARFLERARQYFRVDPITSTDALNGIGAAIGGHLYLLQALDANGKLDIELLHDVLLAKVLGIGEEAVRDERHLRYMRGADNALEAARTGAAQVAFLLRPTAIEDVARISFGGGVMPQKSTDFFPKLLSGLTIYRLGEE